MACTVSGWNPAARTSAVLILWTVLGERQPAAAACSRAVGS